MLLMNSQAEMDEHEDIKSMLNSWSLNDRLFTSSNLNILSILAAEISSAAVSANLHHHARQADSKDFPRIRSSMS